MAEKKTYTVHRSMHGEGRDYVRGDKRDLTEADAAALVKTGALSLEGEEPAVADPAVRHTFGSEPSAVNRAGYTTPTGDGVIAGVPPVKQAAAAEEVVAEKPAAAPAPRSPRSAAK